MNFKILIIAMLCPFFMFAQYHKMDKKREKIEVQKIAFITKQLDFTPEEAQKFWPVYNQFSEAKEQLYEQSRKNRKDIDDLSESEIEKLIDNHIILDQKKLDLKKKYHTEFKKILSNKKIAKLYRAEQMFKKDLLKRLKGRKEKSDYRKR
tara:strand:+ start:6423 stop:6872 length:450 start_codon:yes stop_codon:yes gene_type:complete